MNARSGFPDTGPQTDGTRTDKQWFNATGEDAGIIKMQLGFARDAEDHEERVKAFAVALKEARRLESDIYRYASEVFDIPRDEIDAVGPL
jgi:hypothetical protein